MELTFRHDQENFGRSRNEVFNPRLIECAEDEVLLAVRRFEAARVVDFGRRYTIFSIPIFFFECCIHAGSNIISGANTMDSQHCENE